MNRAFTRAASTAVVLACFASTAKSNGRPPSSSSIHFRTGHPDDIVVGLTWGALVSHDGGKTFQWFCEDAIGYSGNWDPAYEYLADGTILATTFDGLLANRNGCTFDATPLSSDASTPTLMKKFVTAIAQGPDGAVYAGDAGPASGGKIYKSTDSGVTFPIAVSIGKNGDWWSSIAVAPSDNNRVYVAGYRNESAMPRKILMFKSVDGGVSYSPMAITAFTLSEQSSVTFVGISKTNPDLIFARIETPVAGTAGTDYYRSSDGGATWSKRLSIADFSAAFVLRDSDIYISSQANPGSKTFRSIDGGTTFTEVQPSLPTRCAVEAPDKSVWLCTDDKQPISMAIAKSSNLTDWTKVYRFTETEKPVVCQTGQKQYDVCQLQQWCNVRINQGITSTVVNCSVAGDTDVIVKPMPKACCDAGPPGTSGLLLTVGVGFVLFGRRRR
jgi:hypothetical protein